MFRIFTILTLMLASVVFSPVIGVDNATADPPDGQYRDLPTSGTSTVTGIAYVSDRGGRKLHAAERAVILIPDTPHAKNWLARSARDKGLGSSQDAFGPYVHSCVADGDGHFEIRGVPPGDHLLATWIDWKAPFFVHPFGLLDQKLTAIKRYPRFVLTCDLDVLGSIPGKRDPQRYLDTMKRSEFNTNPHRSVLIVRRIAIAEDGEHVEVKLWKGHREWDPVEFSEDEYCKILMAELYD